MGFLETVCETGAIDAAIELKVGQIVAAGPHAVRAQKKLINAWEGLSPAEGIALGIDYLAEAYRTDEPRCLMAPLIKKPKSP
jgi:enoyl-CoA hydratase/carnithine racemase